MKRNTNGILDLFVQHNKAFSARVGYSRAKGTYDRYRVVYRHLEVYVRQAYRRKDLPLSDIRTDFVLGFDTWLRTTLHLSSNTVWNYMIVLKHIITLARNEGLMTFNPFSSYTNSYTSVDRGYLSEEELTRLVRFPARTKVEELVRDLFIFAAFTGLAYIDVKNLREDNIRKFFDGHWWIITRRHKTGVESNIRLLDVPLRLLEKYRGTLPGGRLFPVPTNNCCNTNLQNLARRCGVRTTLTFHMARHTFATIALNRGMPVETLSRILGHTSIRTTQIYAKITNKKISADMAVLSDGLSMVEQTICRRLVGSRSSRK